MQIYHIISERIWRKPREVRDLRVPYDGSGSPLALHYPVIAAASIGGQDGGDECIYRGVPARLSSHADHVSVKSVYLKTVSSLQIPLHGGFETVMKALCEIDDLVQHVILERDTARPRRLERLIKASAV